MATQLGAECAAADNTLGPVVPGTCRVFDFTLLFENVVFSLLPATALAIAACVRLCQLRHAEQLGTTARTWLQYSKQLTGVCFASTQLATLVLWSLSAYRTDASVAAAALSFLASLLLLPLSRAEATRSPRPSIVINVYLLSSALDAVQLRTLWLLLLLLDNGAAASANNRSLAAASSVSLGVKLLLLVLEALPPAARPAPAGTTEEEAAAAADADTTPSREQRTGVYSLRTFWWLNEILWRGRRQALRLENLYAIDAGLKTARYSTPLVSRWDAVARGGGGEQKYGLVRAVFDTLKWPLLAPAVPRVILIGFNFAQPLLLKRAIQFLEEPSGQSADNIGYGLIGATVLVYGGLAISNGYYNHLLYRSIVLVRGSLIDIIYRKSLTIELSAAQKAAPVGLVTAEVERIDFTVEKLHAVWAGIVELAVGIFLLQLEVGYACVAPVVVAVVCTLASSWVSKMLPPRQKAWNQAVQERVALTSTMLSNMKAVKMMGFSHGIQVTLQAARMAELAASAGFRRFMAVVNTIVLVPKQISTPFTLTLFVLAVHNGSLTASTAFTTLSLVEIITTPLGLLLQAIPSITTSLACLDRIQTYLKTPDRADARTPDTVANGSISYGEKGDATSYHSLKSIAISFQAATISYPAASVDATSFTLSPVSLTVPTGTIAVLTGPVGSGKSLLLKAVLGEVHVPTGHLRVRPGPIAYCAQAPWLPNGSVRACIVGMSPAADGGYGVWYDEVVHACALGEDQDLRDLMHEAGAKAVGSRGIGLSEGQKARIALARAIYSRAPLVVLDDVFRSLDLRTEMLICERLLSPTSGLLKRYGMTALVVTHSTRVLPFADQVFVFEGGSVTQVDDIQEVDIVKDQTGDVIRRDPLLLAESVTTIASESTKRPSNVSETSDLSSKASPTPTPRPANQAQQAPKPVHVGSRDKSTYSFYFRPIGALRIGVLLAAVVAFVFSTRFQRIWVDRWTSAGPSHHPLYIGVYFVLVVCGCLSFTSYFWWMFMSVVPVTAGGLHEQLLRSILGAPLAYFTAVDSGVILNRFSQDMAIINGMLPVSFFQCISIALMALSQIALTASGSKYMAATIPPTLAALWVLARFYLLTSQQLRILDIELKAPVYTALTETKDGLATIRAFGWQPQYQRACEGRIDASKRAIYMMFLIQRWLNFVLDLLVGGLATLLVALATQLRAATDPAALGVGLSSVIGLSTLIAQFIVAYTDLENQLGAVARIKDCVESIESEDAHAGAQEPPADWPNKGEVCFSNVTASYGSNATHPALKDISFRAAPGQKVLVCGRTGSGKSTLIAALLRLLDTDPSSSSGAITIDGVDVRSVSAAAVRACVTVIPQAPFFLPGSVRANLLAAAASSSANTTTVVDEATMVAALRRAGLWDLVVARGGLDAPLAAATLAHGQRQLLALAMAMVRVRVWAQGTNGRPVVVMDEAASGVDEETERRMYEIVEEEFRECTVINVAHSLRLAVERFDLVVVLDGGLCVELGHPKELLQAEGEFWRLMNM